MAHKPVHYFECEILDGILSESVGIATTDVFKAASSASDFLPRTPISPSTVKFESGSGNTFQCLAVKVNDLWVVYTIRNEKIRIHAVKQ